MKEFFICINIFCVDYFSFVKWVLAAYHKERTEKICCSIMDSLMEVLLNLFISILFTNIVFLDVENG